MMKLLNFLKAQYSVRIYMNSSQIMEIQASAFDVYGESSISEMESFVE